MKSKTLIVITGPTASGKSALAVELAKQLSAEIIGADSRQVFTGIPIATAMPDYEQREAVTHHLIDFLPLDAYYSASCFETDALKILDDLFSGSDLAIACGGSMMYVDVLCNGIDEIPTVPDTIRTGLLKNVESNGQEWLLNELERIDPEYYAKVDKKNIKRVFHAVEICMAASKPYSALRTGKKSQRPFRILKFALDAPRPILFDRINRRVDQMIANGLEDEARSVYHLKHYNSLNTVGLKEFFAYFDGQMDFQTARLRIGKNTRVYAKKQLTWLRRDPSAIWLDATDPSDAISRIIKEI